ncbi:cyclohexanone monooxygenase [Fusarium oxysporum II5]|uniref:Uncharacterized protein n=1 Tax=Fusarium odoratissimum (strain NRRL 54006) TaxID=1089451 RepID=X0J4S3_FUSO5|nr:uncharacterized protein FOIG_11177 [Fusarium odoratissimum NRRL 54006]EXL96208.1 hypothetical protein FOIG_11177 [Fusarium odoratissimum NRRL 54006]KAK2125410.1 cyclohexanone monooxygenase [Fusarium oxysporum II5]
MENAPEPTHETKLRQQSEEIKMDAENTKAFFRGKLALRSPRRASIAVIGAGASALSFAREVEEGRLSNIEMIIFEKNAGVGGTWWENRYPGCACDIPSHNYQYTWAPNPNWSQYYSGSTEIRHYFERVVEKYGLNKYIKLRHEVIESKWLEQQRQWSITVKTNSTDTITVVVDFLINGGGIVNKWKWPNIPGLSSYKGTIMHSAHWDEKRDVNDKSVVVIGNGSSGVQITASLAKVVRTMTVVMRSPTWITPGFASSFAGPGGTNFQYSEIQKEEFRRNPEKYLAYRKSIEEELNKRQNFFIKGSLEQVLAKRFSQEMMNNGLATKPELAKKMIPSFDVGCRRPTPGIGYLEALSQKNVDVSWGTPQRLTQSSIVLHDGTEIRPDAIICATGFDISYKPRFPIIGRNGLRLDEYWSPDAKAYMSFAVPNFPNYLHYLGPATAASHGSLIPVIEQLTNYFVKIIDKTQREGYSSFEPRQECVQDLDRHHQEYLQHTVWSSDCASTFKNGTKDGRINLLHGGSRLHYLEMLRNPRWEDYVWTLLPGVRLYDFFGNGRSLSQDEGGDLTWYLENPSMAHL